VKETWSPTPDPSPEQLLSEDLMKFVHCLRNIHIGGDENEGVDWDSNCNVDHEEK
jgi:hypothetical protein